MHNPGPWRTLSKRPWLLVLTAVPLTLLLWLWVDMRPPPQLEPIAPEGASIASDVINHDVTVLLRRHGATSVRATFMNHDEYLKLQSGGGASGTQLMWVHTSFNDSSVVRERLAAEHAVRTWLYLGRRQPVMPITGVIADVTREYINSAQICAYISREKFQRLVAELGENEAAVPAMASRVWAGSCSSQQMLDNDRGDQYRRP